MFFRIVPTFIFLGLIQLSPVFSMDNDYELDQQTNGLERKATSPGALSLFGFDIHHIEKGISIVDCADFLPQDIRNTFKTYGANCDRTKYLKQETIDKEKSQISSAIQSEIDQILWLMKEARRQTRGSGEANPNNQNEEQFETFTKEIEDRFVSGRKSENFKKLEPQLQNIEYIIAKKGETNLQMFDCFFAHLLGIGKIFTESPNYKYSLEQVVPLLEQLQHINFLNGYDKKHFTDERIKDFYNPARQIQRFIKNSKEEIFSLHIGGGHRGAYIYISPYQNTLTVDLDFHQLPDIISDINDKDLLTALKDHFKGKLKEIYDTSNLGMFNVLKSDTIKDLAELLAPGGLLMQGWPNNILTITEDKEMLEGLAKNYDLKIKFDPSTKDIIALEKE